MALTPAQQQRFVSWLQRVFTPPPPCAKCGGVNWTASGVLATMVLLDPGTGDRDMVAMGQVVCGDCQHTMFVPAKPLGLDRP